VKFAQRSFSGVFIPSLYKKAKSPFPLAPNQSLVPWTCLLDGAWMRNAVEDVYPLHFKRLRYPCPLLPSLALANAFIVHTYMQPVVGICSFWARERDRCGPTRPNSPKFRANIAGGKGVPGCQCLLC
jgi:hypothetical protein